MFGYIRPVTTELKVKELDAFKACYCGLCHTMGNEYGFISRFLLNYDFVYLTMLLWDKDTPIVYEYKRCAGCPFKKKQCCKSNQAFETAAALSIILSWWKIQDEIADEGLVKSTIYKAAALFLKKAYGKAANRYPEFDASVKEALLELSELERCNCNSVDRTADCFARILKAASFVAGGDKARVLEQILYHTGRWIYIVDACDDFSDDIKSGSYNAVSARFAESQVLTDEVKERMKTTLLHSRNLAGNSFELLDETPWSNIVRNIIVLGMPGVVEAVLTGIWKNRRTGHRNLKDWN